MSSTRRRLCLPTAGHPPTPRPLLLFSLMLMIPRRRSGARTGGTRCPTPCSPCDASWTLIARLPRWRASGLRDAGAARGCWPSTAGVPERLQLLAWQRRSTSFRAQGTTTPRAPLTTYAPTGVLPTSLPRGGQTAPVSNERAAAWRACGVGSQYMTCCSASDLACLRLPIRSAPVVVCHSLHLVRVPVPVRPPSRTFLYLHPRRNGVGWTWSW